MKQHHKIIVTILILIDLTDKWMNKYTKRNSYQWNKETLNILANNEMLYAL